MKEPQQTRTIEARCDQGHCAKCGKKEGDNRQLAALEDIAKSLSTIASVLKTFDHVSHGYYR